MSRRAVWKYVLAPYFNTIDTPYGAQFLYATGQGDHSVVAYALVDLDVPEAYPKTTHRLFLVGTGDPALPEGKLRPLGVASLSGGALMFHVFEVDP